MVGVSAKVKAKREAAERDTPPGPDRTGRYEVVAV
jgi:hypothetical protein